jgi:hypothetical protein
MSLDSCRPLSPLSLSLTSLLSRPVLYPGEAVVESLAPTRFCEWAEGSFIRGDLSRWEGLILALSIFSEFVPRKCTASGGGKPRTMRAGGGTERAAVFGWRAPCPGLTHLSSFARWSDSRASAGPAGTFQRRQTLVCADTLRPLIPVAC